MPKPLCFVDIIAMFSFEVSIRNKKNICLVRCIEHEGQQRRTCHVQSLTHKFKVEIFFKNQKLECYLAEEQKWRLGYTRKNIYPTELYLDNFSFKDVYSNLSNLFHLKPLYRYCLYMQLKCFSDQLGPKFKVVATHFYNINFEQMFQFLPKSRKSLENTSVNNALSTYKGCYENKYKLFLLL